MNLIEQFGGYEKAKRELQLKIDNSVLQCCMSVTADMIQDALFEHRRANNIYEVGDHIITNDDASDGRVYCVENSHHNEHFKIRSKEGFRYCRIWRIERHATPKEIAQGYRDEAK